MVDMRPSWQTWRGFAQSIDRMLWVTPGQVATMRGARLRLMLTAER